MLAQTRADAASYTIDRLTPLGGAWNTQKQAYFLAEDQISLLDQVAVYLPLEGSQLANGRVVNPVLRTPDGNVLGSPTAVSGRRGRAVRFGRGSQVDLAAKEVLARTNEEMALSLHYWPARQNGSLVPGSLVQLHDQLPGAAGPVWSLATDASGYLSFRLETTASTLNLRSSQTLQGNGPSHLVATYSLGRRVRLFVAGAEVASVPLNEAVALGSGTLDHHNVRRTLVPTRLQIAGNGFAGTIDELVVLFGEASANKIGDLASHF